MRLFWLLSLMACCLHTHACECGCVSVCVCAGCYAFVYRWRCQQGLSRIMNKQSGQTYTKATATAAVTHTHIRQYTAECNCKQTMHDPLCIRSHMRSTKRLFAHKLFMTSVRSFNQINYNNNANNCNKGNWVELKELGTWRTLSNQSLPFSYFLMEINLQKYL